MYFIILYKCQSNLAGSGQMGCFQHSDVVCGVFIWFICIPNSLNTPHHTVISGFLFMCFTCQHAHSTLVSPALQWNATQMIADIVHVPSLAACQSGKMTTGDRSYSHTSGDGGISEGWATVELIKLLKAADWGLMQSGTRLPFCCSKMNWWMISLTCLTELRFFSKPSSNLGLVTGSKSLV